MNEVMKFFQSMFMFKRSAPIRISKGEINLANSLITEACNKELFSANVRTVQQLQYCKANKSSEAKSIVSDYEKTSEMLNDISKQYDDFSRMELSEKYKDYAKLKSDEFAERAEAVNIHKCNVQAWA